MKRAMFRDGDFVTIPVPDAAQEGFEAFIREHFTEFTALMAGYGIDANEIQAPKLRQVLFEPEPHDSGS